MSLCYVMYVCVCVFLFLIVPWVVEYDFCNEFLFFFKSSWQRVGSATDMLHSQRKHAYKSNTRMYVCTYTCLYFSLQKLQVTWVDCGFVDVHAVLYSCHILYFMCAIRGKVQSERDGNDVRAGLGQWKRYRLWPDLYLYRWHWRPRQTRGTENSSSFLYSLSYT